jgi:AraC-like DNA-binding protein
MEKQESRATDGNFVLDALRQRLREVRSSPRGAWMGRSPYPLCASIFGAGCEIQSSDYDWYGLRRGTNEFILLQYTLAGEGRLTYHGNHLVVKPGMMMMLSIPDDHRYYLASGQQWEHFYFCLSGHEVLTICRQIIARHGPLLVLPADSPAMLHAAATYERVHRGQIASPYENSALAYSLSMLLLQESSRSHAPGPTVAQLARAEAFCRQHFAQEISIADLAKVAGFSRYHFARLFRQSHGVSPNEFLIDLRISNAARMLRDSQQPVKAVAKACGFADSGYFCKVFRRAIGVSPGSFRSSGMNPV